MAVAGAKPRLQIKRILVPLDFSERANKVLNYAVALAEKMGAKICLLHVVEPVFVSSEPGLTSLPQQTALAEETASKKRLLKIAGDLIPMGRLEKAVIREGTPFFEISAAAKSLKADLIVIATHGRTGLSHVLMGSTAERVVRHAPCPVLTIRRAQ